MKRMFAIFFVSAVILTVSGMRQPLYAQVNRTTTPIPRKSSSPAPPNPCCAITAINASTGVVTAKVNANGNIFQFQVTNAALLNSLKVGQGVYANFTTNQVSLDGSTVCCSIVPPPPPAPPAGGAPPPAANKPATSSPAVPATTGIAAGAIQQKLAPLNPCCAITAINASTGVVTAKENATGKIFQFKVTDATLLNSLKVGQGVYANFGASKVSVDGATTCCNIVTAAAAPATTGVAAGAIQQKLAPGIPCCAITALDTTTGVVTATESATGRSITFQIAQLQPIDGAKLSQAFAAGGQVGLQPIDGAALTSGSHVRFTVQGLQPIDGIVASISLASTSSAASAATGATAPLQGNVASAGLAATPLTQAASLPSVGTPGTQTAGTGKAIAVAAPSSLVQNMGQRLGGLPQLSYGTPNAAPAGPRGMPARWEANGTYIHIRGFDGIEQAQGIPEGVKTMLKIHVMALEPGEPDHYLVNPQLAKQWSDAHPLPPDIKPPSTSDGHTGCNAWSIHCGGEVIKHAEDETSRQANMLRKQAQDDWKNASNELTAMYHELEGCFADQTLNPLDIPVEFAASPSVGIHLEQQGKTTFTGGTASGMAGGTVNLALPMNSPNFHATLEVTYIPCLPFMVRPKTLSGHGTLTVGSRLTAAVRATGQFDENLSVGAVQLPIVLIPIVLFGVPIAEMQVSAYAAGNIEVSGQGTFTANFAMDNPHEMALDFSCSGHGCTGRSQPVAVPMTTTETAQLNGRIRVEPTIFTAIQLDFDFDALSVRAGPQPYLLAEIYGCVGAALSQNLSNGTSTAQDWHALTGDVDWGVDLRGQVLMGAATVFDKTLVGAVKKNTHVWFQDMWPGGSTALYPLVVGAGQASVGTPGLYQIKMPSCYPYPDKVNYQLAWTGSATASQGASGASGGNSNTGGGAATRSVVQQDARLKLAGTGSAPPASGAAVACNLQPAQGSCEFDPTKNLGIDLVWPAAGSYNLAVTAVSDTHGREYKSAQATTENVTVQ